mgnify:CR=1 FL=1
MNGHRWGMSTISLGALAHAVDHAEVRLGHAGATVATVGAFVGGHLAFGSPRGSAR